MGVYLRIRLCVHIHSQNFRLFKDFRTYCHRPKTMFHSFIIVTYLLYLHGATYCIIPRGWGQRERKTESEKKKKTNTSHSKISPSIKEDRQLNNMNSTMAANKNKITICRDRLYSKLWEQRCKITFIPSVIWFSWRGQGDFADKVALRLNLEGWKTI